MIGGLDPGMLDERTQSGGEPGARDSGISLGAPGTPTEIPVCVTQLPYPYSVQPTDVQSPYTHSAHTPIGHNPVYHDQFNPWDRYISQLESMKETTDDPGTPLPITTATTHRGARQSYMIPRSTGQTPPLSSSPQMPPLGASPPFLPGFPRTPDTYNQFHAARERLGGLLSLDRRGTGMGRYWWNGYEKPAKPPPGRRSLIRAHSFNMGQMQGEQGEQVMSQTLPRPAGHTSVCHIRVTSDPGQLDPDAAKSNCRIIPISVETRNPRLMYEGPHSSDDSPPKSATPTGGRYPCHTPAIALGGADIQGPGTHTGGRYPCHTPSIAPGGADDTGVTMTKLSSLHPMDGSPRSHGALLRAQSRSTDELSTSSHEDNNLSPPNSRMTQSFTCSGDITQYDTPSTDAATTEDTTTHSSWQPMVWLSEKGRKLSEFLDRGRSRQHSSEQSPDRAQRRDKKAKARSLSVERSMKLSCPVDCSEVKLRSGEGHDPSKRWCYIYQDNEGIK